jgi:endonuclease YncB( thermonuclease family)
MSQITTCFTSCYNYFFATQNKSNDESSIDDLSTMDNKVKAFTLDGMVFQAKVVDVHDGDTIKAVFKVFDKYYRWNCRIAHVDTPELRTDNAEEKERAIFVRDKVRELILNKIVTLHCLTFDKYGRLLAEVVLPGTNEKLHEWLISNKYANPYEGKTKIKFNEDVPISSHKKRQRNYQDMIVSN